VGVPLLEFDQARTARRPGQHGAGDLPGGTDPVEGAELVAVQIDPQARFRARQDLLDRPLPLLAGPVDDRPYQPAQRRSRPADDDDHGSTGVPFRQDPGRDRLA